MKNSGAEVLEDRMLSTERRPNTAYPRLLRFFAGSSVAAAACGLAALATTASKGLHPAPFLALATLLAGAAACAFISLLVCLTGEMIILWLRR